MSETKIITAKDIETIMRDYEPDTTTIHWMGMDVVVKKTIPFSDVARIVEVVTATCFDADGEYLPACRDFMWSHEIINAYTNIELPDDAETCRIILYDAGLFEMVVDVIGDLQYGEIMNALLANIKHRLDTEVVAIKKNVQEMVDNLTSIAEAFKGVTPDEIAGVFGAFANGGPDEAKIVDALLNKNIIEKE